MFLRLCLFLAAASALQTLPPVEFTARPGEGFSISSAPKTVYVDSSFAETKDKDGLSLIPPSAYEFAETFIGDLGQISGTDWKLERLERVPEDGKGIYLGRFRGSVDNLTYQNGEHTEEAYELEVGGARVYIGGTGARGMWWGTRTLLQQLLLAGNGQLPAGRAVDVPAYVTRGYMLDCGRKWYSASFLKEMCAFASFFKMSEFQYHLMDNYPLNRGRNETWNQVYSHFSLRPENPELRPLVDRWNETVSRNEFEDLQKHCASRGVTVIPEIEAPGHCLAITKWKPELALLKKDLLNLTHPDAISTVQAIWKEFLPWFKTKEVHIGADEYDPTLADVYITYVNEMAKFIKSTASKSVRIWGTYEPSETLAIDKNVIIQHWQYNQSDPYDLEPAGYNIINSEDWVVYMSIKNDHTPIFPARYPQFYNVSRSFHFANKEDWQWEPSLLDPYNITEQMNPNAKGLKGAIMAAWNDNGYDASTQLEAYYTMKAGIPLLAARSWSGSRGRRLDEATFLESSKLLSDNAPAQNLDRRLAVELNGKSPPGPLLVWRRSTSVPNDGRYILGYGSKGMNYSLTLEVTGPFTLSSNDSVLYLDQNGSLVFSTDGIPYPLRHVGEEDGFDLGHPGRIWTNSSNSSHEPVKVPLAANITIKTDILGGSRVWVNDSFAGRFEVFVFGGKNMFFSWSQMAFAAPLDQLEGGIEAITVARYSPEDPPTRPSEGTATPTPRVSAASGLWWRSAVEAVVGAAVLYIIIF
ncbi:conserved hypothetical protein [Uncinocarpus reesii 1704]|uniref:beta-N-acetylhexosaminidase n=1 Tax=Uncinocarpus reesii (strain UAMH 1704) TaxID=336963 RepID=C4JPA2_UNCRE|nr:uncharacterized protein UREG_04484 [Uncinocarpus reesii 1704]EEP79638.1 conserved hypothetical protein [Uncinocarpus reesii 1704]